jgi:hypothetical protein
MALNVGREITALKKMTVVDLRRKYAEVFGESTTSRHRQFLIRRILWRMQANQEGDLSERARQRAKEVAADSDVRMTSPKTKASPPGSVTQVSTIQFSQDDRLPMPGAIVTRLYKGETFEVRVLPHGFEYQGEVYRTLSAVAKKITGTHWNGYHFFALRTKGHADGRKEN